MLRSDLWHQFKIFTHTEKIFLLSDLQSRQNLRGCAFSDLTRSGLPCYIWDVWSILSKSESGWEVSEIIQFGSCKAQQLGTEEKPRQVLWQLWVTLGLSGKEQENPLLAALPVAFLLSSWLVSQEAAQNARPSALSQPPAQCGACGGLEIAMIHQQSSSLHAESLFSS